MSRFFFPMSSPRQSLSKKQEQRNRTESKRDLLIYRMFSDGTRSQMLQYSAALTCEMRMQNVFLDSVQLCCSVLSESDRRGHVAVSLIHETLLRALHPSPSTRSFHLKLHSKPSSLWFLLICRHFTKVHLFPNGIHFSFSEYDQEWGIKHYIMTA